MTRGRRPAGLSAVAALLVITTLGLLGPDRAGAGESLPRFTAPVVDQAGVVPDEVERQVGAALEDYQRRSGNQVAVAVVRTTGGSSLEDYSIDLARAWGVGGKEEDNGVLLLIAYDDRKLRIEVGRGLEGTLTDLQSGRIVRERLLPLMRKGEVGAAVAQGTGAIRQELGDTEVGQLPPPAGEDEGSGNGGSPWLFLALPILGLGLLGSRRFGGGRRGGGLGGPIFWGGGLGGFGGGGFGGGGGGGGGGGFGGGGGGGFGGGGASGGW